MSRILASEIEITDDRDMIFKFAGVEYHLELSGSELRKEIAYMIGMVEDESIDYSVHIGSPYKTFKRLACENDVSEYQLRKWLSENFDKWKKNES